jgi:hypothetical protein
MSFQWYYWERYLFEHLLSVCNFEVSVTSLRFCEILPRTYALLSIVYTGQNAEGVKNIMDHILVKKQQNCTIFKIVLFGLKTHTY